MWTNGIVPTYAHRNLASPPPVEEVPPQHQSFPQQGGGATVPSVVPVRAPLILPPATPELARAYTDEALAAARASEQAAGKLREGLGNTKPEDDLTGWTAYNTRRQVADQDWLTAQQAMAAEVRLTYQGTPANKGAAEAAAGDLAARYGDDPAVQEHSRKALNTVLTETDLQRDSNTKLYDLHRAAGTLDGLIARSKDGGGVSDQQIAAARADYEAQQKQLLVALETELGDEVKNLPTVVQLKEIDLEGHAARGILSRYQADPEFKAVLQAAVVITKTVPFEIVGPEAQMQKLGELTPASLDPSARRLIMGDPRITPVIDRYVDWAASSVNAAYDNAADYYKDIDRSPQYQKLMAEGTPPALAASERLLQLVDHNERPYVTAQIAARIINKLHTQRNADGSTGLGKVIDDLALDGKHHTELLRKDDAGASVGAGYPTYNQVISNLSRALDSAARGSDIEAMQWDSPEIRQAVEGMAGDIAEVLPNLMAPPTPGDSSGMAPYGSRFDVGFREAAADGSVVLGLEVARQLRSQPADSHYQGFDGDKQADKTLSYVSDGIKQFQENTKTLFDQVNVNMAPISSPAARFGSAMTDEQMQSGIDAITRTEEGAKVVETMTQDRKKIDLQGERLIRVGETVQFYRGALDGLDGYKAVDRSRDDLLNTPQSVSTIFLSGSAARRIAIQTARMMLKEELQLGSISPQVYGTTAQLIGDFPEFFAETYILKGLDGKPKHQNVAAIPNVTQAVDATRIGHLPIFVSGTIWGVGGGAQVALTKYIYDNVHLDKAEAWRKPILMGLVGGFAALHLWEAGVSFARMRPEQLNSLPRVSKWAEKNTPWLFMKPGTQREEFTRHVADATRNLTAALAGLMTIAVVWDLSGVHYRRKEGDWAKVGTHGVNLAMDAVLLRLQIREFSKRLLPALSEGRLKRVAGKAAVTPWTLNPLEKAWRAAFRKVPFMATNPIGILVNVGYLTTVLVNLGIDQNRFIDKLERFDNLFLAGGGVKEPQAEVLKQHGWFSGDGKADGLTVGYLALGGDPAKFVDYINATDPQLLKVLMGATAELPEHVKQDPAPELPLQSAYYLTLPADPAAATDNSRIAFSTERNRYEDPTTHMYFDNGRWHYSGPADAGPGAAELRWYDPVTMMVGKEDGAKTWTEAVIPQSELPAAQENGAFLALPADPTKIDVSKHTAIHYNAANQRYEDPVTRTYWDGGVWFYDPSIGNRMEMEYGPARRDDLVFYDPVEVGLMRRNGFLEYIQITSTAGLRNWMHANGIRMPG